LFFMEKKYSRSIGGRYMQPYLVALQKRFGKRKGSFVNFPPPPDQQVIAFRMRLFQGVQISL